MKQLKTAFKCVFSPEVFLWVYPLLLIVPNIVLDITEYSAPLTKITNILFPLGAYWFIMSFWKNVGRTSLFFIPILVFTCVQLVLLHLYGESIIAVDMLLNLVTTNVNEAGELLGNLLLAIILVGIVYIPLLIWGVILAIFQINCKEKYLKKVHYIGEIVFCFGLLSLCLSYAFVNHFSITREIFPINVFNNSAIATQRTWATRDYFHTSASFSHHAASTRSADEREIYVLVIGETSRADNWEIFGYDRTTNPRLSKRTDILKYPKTLSESNITYKSVPLMLSWTTANNFGDSIFESKSIIDAFNEAGYRTAFLSNQGHNHSFIDYFAREAQTHVYLPDDGRQHYDVDLIPELKKVIEESPNNKIFVILHTYGSHYNYKERYSPDEARFLPDSDTRPKLANRPQMINAYDNSIIETDLVLDSVIDVLNAEDCRSAMLYVSDHGEDILDDARERYLHASPVPTYYQLHVPLVIWMSPEFRGNHPAMYDNAAGYQSQDVASSRIVFHTLLDLAGIKTPYLQPEKSLVNKDYVPGPRKYLSDHNEGVALDEAGLRDYDFEQLRLHGICDK